MIDFAKNATDGHQMDQIMGKTECSAKKQNFVFLNGLIPSALSIFYQKIEPKTNLMTSGDLNIDLSRNGWCRGMHLGFYAGDPGSIPGEGIWAGISVPTYGPVGSSPGTGCELQHLGPNRYGA